LESLRAAISLRVRYLAEADVDAPAVQSTLKEKVPDAVISDLTAVWAAARDPDVRAFCADRLELLELGFKQYKLLQRRAEHEATQADTTDFYRVAKIDCHLHYEAVATTAQFREWLAAKLAEEGDRIVASGISESADTVRAVLSAAGFDAKTSAEQLDTAATYKMMHNFGEFNRSFTPMGSEALRQLAFGFDSGLDGGRWAAEYLLHFTALALRHNTWLEPRLTVFGRDKAEWQVLARWAARHNVAAPNLRLAIQMPRIFPVWRAQGAVSSFGEMLSNFFDPLFAATLGPDEPEHAELVALLERVHMFDTVDDESKIDSFELAGLPPPEHWTDAGENPGYSYYAYYFYANVAALNRLRAARGLNTFQNRPHCGESGPVDHLASAFLFCDGISHGINLVANPVLQYLFYICQIGIAVSPISNRALFLRFLDNPFPTFFARGLRCCLTTDDPLQFHMTDAPLLEEYATARHVWDLDGTDLCEIARNSVLTAFGGAERASELLGGDDPNVTNVPSIRLEFRARALTDELKLLGL
jgi:AMP deaminase